MMPTDDIACTRSGPTLTTSRTLLAGSTPNGGLMKQIAKFLPRIEMPASSASTSLEEALPAPLSANSVSRRPLSQSRATGAAETARGTGAEARLTPASAEEMAVCLNELLSVYGVPAGWDVGADVYRRLWAHLPGDVLRDAIDRYMATDTQWFPKPGQILPLAAEEMQARLDRRIALPPPAEEAIDRMPAEECDELMAQYRMRRIVGDPRVRVTVEPRYVVDEVPETIGGKPWR